MKCHGCILGGFIDKYARNHQGRGVIGDSRCKTEVVRRAKSWEEDIGGEAIACLVDSAMSREIPGGKNLKGFMPWNGERASAFPKSVWRDG